MTNTIQGSFEAQTDEEICLYSVEALCKQLRSSTTQQGLYECLFISCTINTVDSISNRRLVESTQKFLTDRRLEDEVVEEKTGSSAAVVQKRFTLVLSLKFASSKSNKPKDPVVILEELSKEIEEVSAAQPTWFVDSFNEAAVEDGSTTVAKAIEDIVFVPEEEVEPVDTTFLNVLGFTALLMFCFCLMLACIRRRDKKNEEETPRKRHKQKPPVVLVGRTEDVEMVKKTDRENMVKKPKRTKKPRTPVTPLAANRPLRGNSRTGAVVKNKPIAVLRSSDVHYAMIIRGKGLVDAEASV
jgi:hypothetical protein